MRKRSQSRRKSGVTSMVEFGPTMWIAFVMIVFPLLAFGSIGLRYTLVNNAVGYAAEAAAQASQFKTSADATHYSSCIAAQKIIDNAAASWHGITQNSTTIKIVKCKYGATTSTIGADRTPLTTADLKAAGTWVYSVLVTVDASINPLFNNWRGPAGQIPGLNAPIRCAISAQRIFESTQGLTQ